MTYIVCHFCGGHGCNMCRTSAAPYYAPPAPAPLSQFDRQSIDGLARALNNLAEALRSSQFAPAPTRKPKKKPPP